MTTEETIKTIEIALAQVEWDYPLEYSVAFAMAIEALENIEHGEWSIAIGYDPKKSFLCSVCNLMNYEPTDYCPHCGARMGKVTE